MSGARTDGGAGGAGAGSISIHETQCLKKFHDQQAALPAEERRRAPTRPLIGGAGGASASLEQRNALAKQAYEEQVMVRCEGCQRTFSGQDRLEIHMRGCDAAKALKQGYVAVKRASMVATEQRLMAAPETNMFTAGDVPKSRRHERLQERAVLEERLSRIEAGSDCDSDELDVLQLRIAFLEEGVF